MIRNFSGQEPIITSNSIFLAGPTTRGGLFLNSWRNIAAYLLKDFGFDGVVYIPEFEEKAAFNLEEQAAWERKCLMSAGVILFYLCRKMPDNPGLSTNVELGTYLTKKPESIVLCSPCDYDKNKYPEWAYKTEMEELGFDAVIYRNLNDSLKAAMNKLVAKSESL